MSYAPFLRSVGMALMTRVHPAVSDVRSRDALEACVRAVIGMAASLETPDAAELAELELPDGLETTDPLSVSWPPENLAANDLSATRIAVGAAWLAGGEWLQSASAAALGADMLRWERTIVRRKVSMMTELERGGTAAQDDAGKLVIDRDALQRYLAARDGPESTRRIVAFRQTIGGRSRQTAVFAVQAEGGSPIGLVVQRDHPANITKFGVAEQYPVLELVSRGKLKTSRPVLLETDPSVLGAPFMILERAPGSVAGSDYFDPPRSPGLGRELAGQLAVLHAIDPAPLAGIVTVTADAGDTAGWRNDLGRIEAAWQNFAHAPSMTIAAALAWMRARVDQIGRERSIIHNDAAFHNILVEDGHFSSLLDWELVHVGHPAEDLGYCRAFVQEIMPWGEFVDAYVAAGGLQFSREVIDYFSLRAGIHLMTLLQYGRSMFISGVTSDINLAEAATSFTPKHYNRIATMLEAVLAA